MAAAKVIYVFLLAIKEPSGRVTIQPMRGNFTLGTVNVAQNKVVTGDSLPAGSIASLVLGEMEIVAGDGTIMANAKAGSQANTDAYIEQAGAIPKTKCDAVTTPVSFEYDPGKVLIPLIDNKPTITISLNQTGGS